MTTPEVEPDRLNELVAPGAADKLVLDAGQGGTGSTFDWQSIPDEIKPTHCWQAGSTPKTSKPHWNLDASAST